MKILITTLIILTIPVFGNGQVSIQNVDMTSLAATSYDTKELSKDIVSIGGNPEKAVGIQEYFTGKKPYLTIDERDEWINLAQHSIEQLNIKSFGAVQNKQELIKKLNYLIGEHAKVIAIKEK